MSTRLKPGDSIVPGGPGITSQDIPATWEFVLTSSSNPFLVVRQINNHSVTPFTQAAIPGDTCKMQTNGDLVLTASLWDSGTINFRRAYLEVTTAGHAIIYEADGTPIWDNGNRLYSVSQAVEEVNGNIQRLQHSLRVLEQVLPDVHGARKESDPNFAEHEERSGSRAKNEAIAAEQAKTGEGR